MFFFERRGQKPSCKIDAIAALLYSRRCKQRRAEGINLTLNPRQI
jgi:hypothetical protein